MLTGVRPFQAEEPAAVMNQILTKDPPPIAGVPAGISEAVERCLRRDPGERYQSTREMIASLSAAVPEAAPTAITAEPTPEPEAARARASRLPSMLRRWRMLAAIVLALAVGALFLFRPETPPAGETTVVPRFPPSLTPRDRGLVATYLYGGMEHVGGIAVKPDGTVLVAVGAGDEVPPGVYVARPGDDWDPSDAYTPPGPPFVSPGGIAVHPDGRVVVADPEASTVWVIPRSGARAEPLTTEVPSPCDVVVAAQEFDGPNVDPGDFLVCAGSSAGPDAFGLYSVDAVTGAVHHQSGPPELQNGLVWADFGPDGTLYAVEDDRITRDGFTIVTISPDGGATPFLPNGPLPGNQQPMAGPVAVHPTTGDYLAAYRSTIYRLPAGWRPGDGVEVYADQGLEITALEFSSDGSSLLVSDAGDHVLSKIASCPIEGKLLITVFRDPTVAPERTAFSYFLEGTSDNTVELPVHGHDLSPLADEVAYGLWERAPVSPGEMSLEDKPWLNRMDICKTDLSGPDEVNLTRSAGLGGINCRPLWSPDGRRIAFLHCDPIKGTNPCDTGFDIWVMRADGTEPVRVASAGWIDRSWEASRATCRQMGQRSWECWSSRASQTGSPAYGASSASPTPTAAANRL
jgi:hypothetical protein